MDAYEKYANDFFLLIVEMGPLVPVSAERITRGEMRAVMILGHEGRTLTAGELSKIMGLCTGRTTAVLDSLEDKGYIARNRSKKDHRVVEVALSPKGLAFLESGKEAMLKEGSAFFKELGDKDSKELLHILRKAALLKRRLPFPENPLLKDDEEPTPLQCKK
jgi:DNA-binding MarR family transcriptional regulator